jgi:hypothetical protein
MYETIKIGLIGVGGYGKTHLDAIRIILYISGSGRYDSAFPVEVYRGRDETN